MTVIFGTIAGDSTRLTLEILLLFPLRLIRLVSPEISQRKISLRLEKQVTSGKCHSIGVNIMAIMVIRCRGLYILISCGQVKRETGFASHCLGFGDTSVYSSAIVLLVVAQSTRIKISLWPEILSSQPIDRGTD